MNRLSAAPCGWIKNIHNKSSPLSTGGCTEPISTALLETYSEKCAERIIWVPAKKAIRLLAC